jgi:oligopeptide/dipeptide ABC transporter ATP-binding protein
MLLEIQGLTTEIATREGRTRALDSVDLSIARAEAVGVVGESGSGKSMLALAIMGLLPPAIRVTAGSIRLDGQELLGLPERRMRAIRGARIGLVFQEPMTALNPLQSIGTQVAEALTTHGRAKRAEAMRAAVALLDRVGIPDAPRRAQEYPHRLSGGLRQRAVIAIALACDPVLLIADEPTTALDVTIQAQILGLIRRLATERGVAVLLTTHDLGSAYEICDAITVMYAGQEVESAPVDRFFAEPRHPYTRRLLASLPRKDGEVTGIPGEVPNLTRAPGGCRFNPRCLDTLPACDKTRPPILTIGAGHMTRCHAVSA